MLGVSSITIENWEGGKYRINQSRELAIHHALGDAMDHQDAWDAECAPDPRKPWQRRVFDYFARHRPPREPLPAAGHTDLAVELPSPAQSPSKPRRGRPRKVAAGAKLVLPSTDPR